MSNKKRKRNGDEPEALHDAQRKQKKRRKSRHKAAAAVNVEKQDRTGIIIQEPSTNPTKDEQSAEAKKKNKQKTDGAGKGTAGKSQMDGKELDRAQRRLAKRTRRKEAKETTAKSDKQERPSKQGQEHLSWHKVAKPKKEQQGPAWKWQISEAVGGRMLRIDPMISPEEDYVLIAYDNVVCVYSTSTSLLIRKLRVKRSEPVSSFAFSPTDLNQLYISKVNGVIEKWNWNTGMLLDSWDTRIPVQFVATAETKGTDVGNSLVYTIDRPGGNTSDTRWRITAHRLMARNDTSKTDLSTLLKYDEPLSAFRILEEGRLIIATSGHKLLLGITENPDQPFLRDLSYVWREISCSEWVTSLDIRVRPDPGSAKVKGTKGTPVAAIDIVVGGLKGAIFVYEDLLRRLISKEKSEVASEDDITPRKMHWHRTAVASVKWSLDGNYVISGGHETVLIIWQLDTGEKQELPHLSAAIESIVVSPAGASYAVRLADNSTMILSTTELQPTFNVAGIQLPRADEPDIGTPFVPTVDVPTQSSRPKQNQHFPTVSSSKPGQLLLAVPSDISSAVTGRHSCFLQTFDINSEQQLSRQALSRNNVTTLTMGPESNTIEEPNVTHMQLSHDGMWLATVDEWMPPMREIDHLAFDGPRMEEERSLRTEVYLKFWEWNDDSSAWELVSRIDNPQPTLSNYTGSIAHLSANPSEIGFATAGDDGIIRMWKPQVRKRHGLGIRNKEGKSLTSWSCRWTLHLPLVELSKSNSAHGIKLAFSFDGSVLAAALPSSTSVIHRVNTRDGTLHSSLTGQFEGPLYGLGIIHKYLIILSNDLRVWDMVDEDLLFGLTLDPLIPGEQKRLAHTHLAVDQKRNTFAVAVPEFGVDIKAVPKLKSRVAVFDAEHPEPHFSFLHPNPTVSLVPASGKEGFYCIDDAAEVRTVFRRQTFSQTSHQQSTEQKKLPAGGLGNIYGNGKTKGDEGKGKILDLESENIRAARAEDEDGDTRVVSPEKLAEVFAAASASALPPLSELFEKVAFLYNGRSES